MTSPRWSCSFCRGCFRGLFAFIVLLMAVPAASSAEPGDSGWSYKPIRRPALPKVQNESWARNPIDFFVLDRLEKAGLKPTPASRRITLLRRVTYDLTGLLPSSTEVADFLHDQQPGAYERVADRLLASHHFGERWAQHWLDVVRYSETEGFKVDRLRPEAFRYRDFVIRAFNQDLPYDRFLTRQIAGDETEPNQPDAIIATGFWRLHMEESNGDNYRRIRQDILDDNTDTLASAVMGLTFSCARCHDHKFDPISQRDYYRLQAFLVPMIQRDDVPLGEAREIADRSARLSDWERRSRSIRDEMCTLTVQIERIIGEEIIVSLDTETQEALHAAPERRTTLQRQIASLASKQVMIRQSRAYRRLTPDKRAKYDDLQKRLSELDFHMPTTLPLAMSVADVGANPPEAHLMGGGNYLRPKEVVQPGFPSAIGDLGIAITSIKDRPDTTGRRTALARWLCSSAHPLTSRVIVNRVWQSYFGEGIVGTPNDFGRMGEPATHPELLDFLAYDLMSHGWKLKRLHRSIVTSAAYMQASITDLNPTEDRAERLDPDNDLIWHSQLRRRDAESLHDITLQAAGQLNGRMYGLSSQPELPAPVSDGKHAWYADAREEDRNRRAIYITSRRNLALPLLAVFDAPDRLTSCPTRSTTISAPQALALLNSKFTLDQGRTLAEHLIQAHGSDLPTLIRQAYQATYNREPAPQELAAAMQFIDRQARLVGSSPMTQEPIVHGARPAHTNAVVDLCHALMNAAEFLYVE